MVVEHYMTLSMTVDAQHLFDAQHYTGATQGGVAHNRLHLHSV